VAEIDLRLLDIIYKLDIELRKESPLGLDDSGHPSRPIDVERWLDTNA
jgi:hypothetical protein